VPSKTALITGCSSRLSHDLAERLTHANYTVIGTICHPKTITDLPVVLQTPLDVTDPISITCATYGVVHRFERIDVLINSAA
jgi:NADP-dependent 3-hydroxy acid dehydrogenase YdfG